MHVEIGTFNVEERRAEKQRSRDEDAARLSRGEVSAAELNAENGFFSVLDRSQVRLIARRVRVSLR